MPSIALYHRKMEYFFYEQRSPPYPHTGLTVYYEAWGIKPSAVHFHSHTLMLFPRCRARRKRESVPEFASTVPPGSAAAKFASKNGVCVPVQTLVRARVCPCKSDCPMCGAEGTPELNGCSTLERMHWKIGVSSAFCSSIPYVRPPSALDGSHVAKGVLLFARCELEALLESKPLVRR